MSFLLNSYRFGVATTQSFIAVQDFALATATGNADYTTAALGGLTPKAVLMITNGHDSASPGSETAGARLCIGFTDGTDDPSASFSIADNVASTNCSRANLPSSILRLNAGGGNDVRWTGGGSLIADGLRINYTTVDTSGRSAAFVGFGHSSFAAKTGSLDLGTGTSALACATTFTPDVVLLVSSHTANSAGAYAVVNTQARYMFGLATNHSGSVVQKSVYWTEGDNLAAAAPRQAILTNKIGHRFVESTGAFTFDLTAGGFSPTGFTLTPSASASSGYMQWMALSFGGRQYKLVDYTSPTTTGNHSITGVGFTPSFALVVLTNLEATDPAFPIGTSDLMSGLSFSFIGDEQHAFSMRNDSGAAPTDCASLMKATALLGANATSCNAIEATLARFNSDGMTLNYSAVQGTGKKGFILFIE